MYNIDFIKFSESKYDIIKDNVNLGELIREVDGFFLWYPPHPSNGGAWPSWIIKIISNKMDELNK